MSSRKAARRAALVVLYQWDLTRQPVTSLYDGELDQYSLDLAEEVVTHADALDARITVLSDAWPADRLGHVERTVLRMALVELDRGEIPAQVAISEAVSLAKRFASEDAARLINGILGRMVQPS